MSVKPGYKWRFNAPSQINDLEGNGLSYFDELVVDEWLHIEQMDDNNWWMRIGSLDIRVRVDDNGDMDIALDNYDADGKVAEMISNEIKRDIVKQLYSGKIYGKGK